MVLSLGEITFEPLAPTLPTPLSMVTESALLEPQVKVAGAPAFTVVGSTVTLTVAGGIIFTVATAVAVPPAPLAVAVKVFSDVIETCRESLSPTLPMLLSMVTEVAFEELHNSVVLPPMGTLAGVAVSVIVGAACSDFTIG